MSAATLDLDRVVELVRRADTFVCIEQTGGGTATLYAGPRRRLSGEDYDRYTVTAGPGSVLTSRASIDGFYLGPDNDSDDGSYLSAADGWDEARVAAEIVRLVAELGREDAAS